MRLSVGFGILALALMGGPALADDRAAICAKIVDSDDARLRCYDNIFRPPETPVVMPPPTDAARAPVQWIVRTETSPIDDSQNVYLFLEGTNGIVDRFGTPTKMELWIACREKKTSLYIRFGGQFMSDIQGNGDVTYRLDKKKAAHVAMVASSNNEALGLWGGGSSIPFVKGMFGSDAMFLQAAPYNENAVNDVFPISGLEAAIAPLRKSCAW